METRLIAKPITLVEGSWRVEAIYDLEGLTREEVQIATTYKITIEDGNPSAEKEAQLATNGITTKDGNPTGEELQITTKYGIITEDGYPSGEDVQIATKLGISTKDGNTEMRDNQQDETEACVRSLLRLYGYSDHRTDTQVPFEITGLEGQSGEMQKATMHEIITEDGNPSVEEAQIAANGITIEDGDLAGEEVQIAIKYGITVKDGSPSDIAPNVPPLLPTTAKKINLHELRSRKLLLLPASPETERSTPPLPPTPKLPPSPPSPPSSHTVFTQELAAPPVPGPPSCMPKCY
ncbi:hypothetical protein AAHA92_26246 [Salvia divinorum]|uniref:Uncharacterized protein n=1 Tax=Salvia divinorum TaxID=28513 RepID=A0ABD1GDB8_SALDI